MFQKSQMKDIETGMKNESQIDIKLFEKISNPHMDKTEFGAKKR